MEKAKNTECASEPVAEWVSREVERHNSVHGNLKGYDCKECLNRGTFMRTNDDGYNVVYHCECMKVRRSMRQIKKSGLDNILDDCTFEKFTTEDSWQVLAKQKAIDFTTDTQSRWFFAGGQVGAGKTHLCTAITGWFLRQGKPARYMLWRDEVVRLKGMVNDGKEYAEAISELKKTAVLYIDDFFKTERNTRPTAADINVAFELINSRYYDKNLITIISSERTSEEIIKIDEAIGSRIFERAKRYCLNIEHDKNKNFRLRKD